MICCQAGIAPAKGDVVADMAGGVQHVEAPAVSLDHLTIGQCFIGDKRRIDAFAATYRSGRRQRLHYVRAPGLRGSKRKHWRICARRQFTRQRRMVEMRVGHNDMADVLVWSDGLKDRLKMRSTLRTGINHGQCAAAEQIGVRAAVRHGRWVGGHDAAQTFFQRFSDANGRIKVIWCLHLFGLSLGRLRIYALFMSFDFLKRYMPRGIYGRAALILLLPVVFLQLVVTVIFAQRHFEGVTHQMTDSVLRELAMVVQTAQAQETPDAATAAVARMLAPLEIALTGVAQADIVTTRSWYDYSGSVIIKRLTQQLDGFAGVDLTTDSKRVSVFVQSDLGPLKITFDRRRISASNPHQMFVYTIAFGVLMTVIAIIYLRNQLRPIKRLARAAEAFGRGRHLPFTPSGAVEMRAAGSAFIDMRQRIERHIEQRTLMLSGVSHDLRTPLTRLRLGLAMLDDDEAEPLLRDVEDMQGMLDEFLSFAKGAAEGEPKAVDPMVMVEDIVAGAQRAGRNVILRAREGDGQGTVTLREVAMRRAVDNLISNGVRYGARAEVSVMLSDKTLRIRVEDDGPGIPEAQREQATRPFTRLDPSRNQDKGGGVGLGLAIAVDIARSHGGVLRLGHSDSLGGLRADIVIAR